MSMIKMMQQAQQLQKKMEKETNEFHQKLFEFENHNDLIKCQLFGSKKIKSIFIDKTLVDAENKEILEDLLVLSLNEAFEFIEEEEAKIQNKYQKLAKI